MPMKLSDIEEEVVFLKAITEIIDSMVNFAILTLHGSDPDASVLFLRCGKVIPAFELA